MRFVRTFLSILVVFAFVSTAFAQGGAEKAKPKAKPTLIVFNIVAERGVDQGLVNLITEVVIDAATKTGRFTVMGQKELDKMLSWEQQKQLKGCSDTQCLVQIAGAMGAAYYIEGSIGALADMYMVTLKLIDSYEVKVIERGSERVDQNEKALVKSVDRIAASILKIDTERTAVPVTAPVPKAAVVAESGRGETQATKPKAETPSSTELSTPVTRPMNPYNAWGHGLFWSGLALAGGMGGAFTYLWSDAADSYRNTGDPVTMSSYKDNGHVYLGLAATGYAIGGAAMIAGVVMWALAPSMEKKKAEIPNIMPAIGAGSAGVVVNGEW